jgi:Rrf2 family protein
MRLSARVDYALRAVAELAASSGERDATARPATSDNKAASGNEAAVGHDVVAARPVTAERLAQAQQIPPKFLESILLQLRRGGVVTAQRGPEGGYRLARPADEITLAEIIRVIDGPLANVRGQRPEHVGYRGAAEALQDVWIALRASERQILELVTIADVAGGDLPERVRELAADPAAWV